MLQLPVHQDVMPASPRGLMPEVPYGAHCAHDQFVCALSQDRLRRRAYTSAPLPPARSFFGIRNVVELSFERRMPNHVLRGRILFLIAPNSAISNVFSGEECGRARS